MEQSQPDGSIVSLGDIALPVQSTAEAVSVLRMAAPMAAEAFVLGYPYRGTEVVARQLKLTSERGSPTQVLVSDLLLRQSSDGGMGELPGYDSTPLDTALALRAFVHAGQTTTPQNLAALNYFQNAMCWSLRLVGKVNASMLCLPMEPSGSSRPIDTVDTTHLLRDGSLLMTSQPQRWKATSRVNASEVTITSLQTANTMKNC
ncbi:MAG TPA: hypothetical protein PKE27_00980 [Povalibacter sp.]|uniref:hypothetical protein n=1 Tax=Povalibacter sp. TaxID=1962978 RepID=UPI002B9149B6|nr:hypothetical protein [Povalibacter sp.]HMN43121.1 hypothetical protein [Povalibacter sp.]